MNDENDKPPAPAAAKPKPVLYTFTCGGAKVPCKLTYTFDSDLHKRRKLPALAVRKPGDPKE